MIGKVRQLPKDGKPGVIRFDRNREFSFDWEDVKGDGDSMKEGQKVDFKQDYQNGKHWAVKIRPVGDAKPKSQKTEKTKEQKQSKSPKPTKPPPPPQSQNELPSPSQSPPVGQQPSQSTQLQTEPPQAKTGFPAPSKAQPEPPNGFVNPYNFVPLGEKEPKREKPEFHEYFVGKSGRITCKLTLKTPFFTPHPERQWQTPNENPKLESAPDWINQNARDLIQNAKAEHDVLGLLRDHKGNPFIPGSLLKGVFRSVSEALSNSCLSIIDFQWDLLERRDEVEVKVRRVENYYSFRQVQSPPFVGRVTRLATPTESGTIEVSTEKEVIHRGQRVSESERGKIFFRNPAHMPARVKIFGDELSQFKDGDPVVAMCKTFPQTIKVRGQERRIPILTVQNLRRDEGGELQPGEQRGIIRIADVTDEKKSHRFIFWPEEQDKPRESYFSWRAQLEYNRTLKDSIKEDQKEEQFALEIEMEENKQQKKKAIGTRFQRHELAEEDIVYFNESKED